MTPTRDGAFRFFNFRGIDVFVHWSWFVVAAYELQYRKSHYSSMTWNAVEYLALFGIVLLHEFGHAFACRSTGGRADTIVLWPLGGVAYVAAPHRPGAQLWSIAAGPLVNVALVPILWGIMYALVQSGAAETGPDTMRLLGDLQRINLALLIFNVLPIYPLDGGQILRSLLWFPLGPARSLQIAVVIGLAGAIAGGLYAFSIGSIWLGIMAAFIFMNCFNAWKHARAMLAAGAARLEP